MKIAMLLLNKGRGRGEGAREHVRHLINMGSDSVVISAGTVAARIAYRVDKLRGQLARIESERIVYTEQLMRKEGYKPLLQALPITRYT